MRTLMKPFMLVPALVAVFVVAWPANGDAQYRGHYGGRVVGAAPYYPYYPFAFGRVGVGLRPWYHAHTTRIPTTRWIRGAR